MLVGKDSDGNVVSWMETYFSDGKVVTVNASRAFTVISTQDTNTGKVKSETFFGKLPLPGTFEPDKR
ncbi:MAG TPA: hypothetical protein VE994_09780 [Terriglobales bacterium]|nr:hypothetical protein [Terriglobales bacterium]